MLRHAMNGVWVAALVLAASSAALAAGWSGEVVDIRTGKPVPGTQVQGGWTGRADVAPRVTVGANGSFAVTYPDHEQKPEFYALWVTPATGDYLHYREYRKGTGTVHVGLVPFMAHIRGRVVDADTGQPVVGIAVDVARPGRYLMADPKGYQPAVTDANGEYQVRVPAYEVQHGVSTEGVPEEYRVPAQEQAKGVTDYWLDVNYGESKGRGKEYRGIATLLRDANGQETHVPIPLLSSVEPVIFTRVDFKLTKKTSDIKPAREHVTVSPPGVQPAAGSPQRDDLVRRIDALIKTLEGALAEAREIRRAVQGTP